MSEKGQPRKSMFSVPNMEELRRLYDSDTPVLAYNFKRQTDEGWTPEHSHQRGQLVALTHGLLIVETERQRWMFPSGRCAWTPPNCQHAARSVGGAAGAMVDLSPEMCRGLPKTPCMRMLGMTARWTPGRRLPEWLAALSCVRFRLRQACHLAVGDSRRGYSRPWRCWHKGNLSRRWLSQSGTTVSVLSLRCFGRCWEPHHRHTFEQAFVTAR